MGRLDGHRSGSVGDTCQCDRSGTIRTEMFDYALDRESEIAAALPVRRIGEPADIAAAAVWLASEESTFVTGADIVVDGGYTA
jgi:NAD(P)-dependent dehydrogenase (short-subunit alcohol dehydrogenase family)